MGNYALRCVCTVVTQSWVTMSVQKVKGMLPMLFRKNVEFSTSAFDCTTPHCTIWCGGLSDSGICFGIVVWLGVQVER